MVLIQNVRIIGPTQDTVTSIRFDSLIREIGDLSPQTGEEVIETTDQQVLMPGMIDPHVHFRTPGLEYKENFATGSAAAVAGGITMVFDMPNTIPPVLTPQAFREKKQLVAQQSITRFGLHMGVSDDQTAGIHSNESFVSIKMFLDDTTGNLKMTDRTVWDEVLRTGKKVIAHAEGDTFLELVDRWQAVGAPGELHLVHTTQEKEVKRLRELKADPKFREKITAEVCPHHLLWTQADVANNPRLTMKPNLASSSDQDSLWQAIEDGTIDFFATDHAPHLPHEKDATPPAFGVPGIQEIFGLLIGWWQDRGWDWQKLVRMTSTNAAQTYNLPHPWGTFALGSPADLVLWDFAKPQTIQNQTRLSRCGWTPYEGIEIPATLQTTWIGGTVAYEPVQGVRTSFRGGSVL